MKPTFEAAIGLLKLVDADDLSTAKLVEIVMAIGDEVNRRTWSTGEMLSIDYMPPDLEGYSDPESMEEVEEHLTEMRMYCMLDAEGGSIGTLYTTDPERIEEYSNPDQTYVVQVDTDGEVKEFYGCRVEEIEEMVD